MALYGGYSIDIYCDIAGCQRSQRDPHSGNHVTGTTRDSFHGQSEASCLKQARAAGWSVGKYHVCPKCKRAGKRPKPKREVESDD